MQRLDLYEPDADIAAAGLVRYPQIKVHGLSKQDDKEDVLNRVLKQMRHSGVRKPERYQFAKEAAAARDTSALLAVNLRLGNSVKQIKFRGPIRCAPAAAAASLPGGSQGSGAGF
jgi:hypothetical protein